MNTVARDPIKNKKSSCRKNCKDALGETARYLSRIWQRDKFDFKGHLFPTTPSFLPFGAWGFAIRSGGRRHITEVANRYSTPAIALVEGIIQEYHERAKFRDCADGFYTLDPTTWGFTKKLQGTSESANTEDDNRYLAIHKRLDYKSSTFTMYPDLPVQSFNALKTEAQGAYAPKFVLVAVSDDAPSDAFVSVKHNGKWYFILNNDDISKSNLALITQITTVQAIPS